MNPPSQYDYDAIVVGSGPNGLAAAITLAQEGLSVLVLEGHETIGGGMRSAEVTLPGFVHDICSAIHPLAVASPFFRQLPLEDFGLRWIYPPTPLAHPLDGGTAAAVERSLEETCQSLKVDGGAYRDLFEPLVGSWEKLLDEFLGPFPFPPKYPLLDIRFGLRAIRSARGLAESLFRGEHARALFTGMAGHSMLPLEKKGSAAFALMLGLLAHAVGWPIPAGGSQKIADALAGYLRSLAGEIVTGEYVRDIDYLPTARATFFDGSPRQLLDIAGKRLPARYRRQLAKFRYGPGIFKVDYALDSPIPWQAEACQRAGTVHLGGTLEEIAASERAVWRGEHPVKPYLLLAQQSLFDKTRAPAGQHTVWAYCHVPHGSTVDMSDRIEAQIERFAPGFRERILARHTRTAVQVESYNPNYVGGDINGGVQDLRQLFTRPVISLTPYRTPLKGVYLCSSSTPPGGGVHGMSGYHAARLALKDIF